MILSKIVEDTPCKFLANLISLIWLLFYSQFFL